MKYLVFAGDNFYPEGGWKDFIGKANSLEEAEKHLLALTFDHDWFEIIELESGKRVKSGKVTVSYGEGTDPITTIESL